MPEPLPSDASDLPAEPIELLLRWLDDATATGMTDANAMTLATAGADGAPSARTVLLRGVGDDGLRWYTNRQSLKGRQLAENARAQLLLYWRDLGRQIAVHGPVRELGDAESDEYFATRPRAARLGAWASRQGSVIASRDELLARVRELEEQHPDEVPRPPHWGGYVLQPQAIEFWQAGEFRLHDRFLYTRADGGGWSVVRLSP